jgi:hypothetical protein
MSEVYFYLPEERMADAVECGIKLSEWYSREVEIEGNIRRCITALLNPRDGQDMDIKPGFKCLRIEVQKKYCNVADSLLYKAGLAYPEVMELYRRSIIPMESYTFGYYKLPEVLISSTILSEQVSVPGKWLDTPVLYSNSPDIYFANLFEELNEEHEDINDTLLYLFFRRLCDEGKARGIEDNASGIAVFTRNRGGRAFTVKIPDLGGF